MQECLGAGVEGSWRVLVSDKPQQFGVIPAQAGIQRLRRERHWVPAFAGTTQQFAADRLSEVAEHRR
jgi:hypothetical protein